MSIGQIVLLSGATSTGAGTAWPMATSRASFQFDGITTATVAIQVSNDGQQNWHTIYSVTSDQVVTISEPYVWLRINVTAYTSGTITVTAAMDGI